MSTSTWTSTFKRLSISTSNKDHPSTFAFDRLKMASDQHEREMKTFKAKPSHEENNDEKIYNCVPSHMKTKITIIDINTKGSLMVKPRLIIFTNPTNEEGEQIFDEHMCC